MIGYWPIGYRFSPAAQFERETDEVRGSLQPKFALDRTAGVRNRLVGHAQGLGNRRQALTFSQQSQNIDFAGGKLVQWIVVTILGERQLGGDFALDVTSP